LAGVRAAVDAYRDRVVAERASPACTEWLERARDVDGLTLPTELSMLFHLALHAPGRGQGRRDRLLPRTLDDRARRRGAGRRKRRVKGAQPTWGH
jgi:hypothetical protein